MLVVSLPLCGYVLWSVRDTNYDVENVIHAEDIDSSKMHGAAVPTGHHLHDSVPAVREQAEEKKEDDVYTRQV